MNRLSIFFLVFIANVLSPSGLKAQGVLGSDTLSLSSDTVWKVDLSFGEALVIPSYEELLEVYYEAVVTVDERLHFNPYRYVPRKEAQVNPFVYQEVVYAEDSDYFSNSSVNNEDEYWNEEIDPDRIYTLTKAYISIYHPELVTATWDMLPDPPQTGKADIKYAVDLDLREINKRSRRISRPESIVKQSYVYQPWYVKVVSMASASQTAFSNWAKGGNNSFSISGRVVGDADYGSINKKTQWNNDFEFRIGYVQQEDDPFVKNLDFFRLNTQYARYAVNRWFYAANAEFTTQFFEGYDLKKNNFDDPISSFLSPAYFKFDIGLDYKYGNDINKKLFSMQTSPLSYKLTYVRDSALVNPKKYGIDAGERARQEIGGSLAFMSEYDFKDKFNSYTRLLFFSNYAENPQNVDVNWNTRLTYHFSRILAMSFTLDMVYDDDEDILINETADGTKIYGQRLQIKEFLGFGLTYRLM